MKKNIFIAITITIIIILGAAVTYLLVSQKTNNSSEQNISGTETDSQSAQSSDKVDDAKLADIMSAVDARFKTVKVTRIFTEANDPNGVLGKPESYTNAAAFWDTRTRYSEENAAPEEKGKWGTDAGGAVEVFANSDDAAHRVDLLKSTQGTVLDAGAVERHDNIVLRASSKLTKSQQDEIINFLMSQFM